MTTISFCIITSGTEDDQLKRSIDSIIALNIPTYEIVVVGGNSEISNISNRIKWVPFDESSRASEIVDNKPGRWITRKKNLSVQNAQYEVCVVIHDYIQFDSNWWIEFEKILTSTQKEHTIKKRNSTIVKKQHLLSNMKKVLDNRHK
jgi:hypothetical protein